uniref:Probable membrane-associated kinase regulator 6 isoform X1 n=1 Tax=Nicotiana sylvestris TaxID=4096 RepID=A0A1U7YAN6_NICSY|nr:PREDICTED: probable membrane-associated kinase regulator 6 isoform X1 [Nicotiana sylvestris]
MEDSLMRISTEYASDDFDEAAYIEMDPTLSPSKSFSNVNPQDLISFNFPTSAESPLTLVHADEFISKGSSPMPLLINPMKMESTNYYHLKTKQEVHRVLCISFRRFGRLFDFLKPLCQKIRCDFGCKSGISTSTIEGVKIYCSQGTSPRTSLTYSVDDWRRSCDSESSIYEAVLHCKRTMGTDQTNQLGVKD